MVEVSSQVSRGPSIETSVRLSTHPIPQQTTNQPTSFSPATKLTLRFTTAGAPDPSRASDSHACPLAGTCCTTAVAATRTEPSACGVCWIKTSESSPMADLKRTTSRMMPWGMKAGPQSHLCVCVWGGGKMRRLRCASSARGRSVR